MTTREIPVHFFGHAQGAMILERLISYLSLCSDFLPSPCFVLVGASAFFDAKEMEQLQEMARYQKWNLLRLEHYAHPQRAGEVYYIIDKDLCELRLDTQL